MELSSLNANLIPILGTLLEERSIHCAAIKLNLDSSVIRRKLQILREFFNDDLLIADNNSKKMSLTSKAIEIEPLVKKIIAGTQNIISMADEFSPAKLKNAFNIVLGSVITYFSFPHLVKRVNAEAPGVSLNVFSLADWETGRLSHASEMDVIISSIPAVDGFVCKSLMECKNAAIIAKRKMGFNLASSEEIFKSYTHLKISCSRRTDILMNYNMAYSIVSYYCPDIKFIELPYLNTILRLIQKGKYITILPEFFAGKLAGSGEIEILEIPYEIPKSKIYMNWPEYKNSMPAHIWFRNLVSESILKN